MSDRLFRLEQEISRMRQQSQQGLSEATAYDDSPQNNRFLALEQSLDESRQLGYHSMTNAYGFNGSNNPAIAVQMSLSPNEKEELINFVKELIGKTTIPNLLMKDINDVANTFKEGELAQAQKRIKLYVREVVSNELGKKSLVKDWGMSASQLTKGEVSMGEETIALKGSSGNYGKTVLWTMSIGGCLGVAADNGQQSFLAHWIPTQMTEKELPQNLESLNNRFGLGKKTKVWLSSPSNEASYVQRVKQGLRDYGWEVVAVYASDTLAINVNTGDVEHDFKTSDLRDKSKKQSTTSPF